MQQRKSNFFWAAKSFLHYPNIWIIAASPNFYLDFEHYPVNTGSIKLMDSMEI